MADETRTLIAAGIGELTREATTPPAPYGYGRDLSCVSDLTTSLTETRPDTIESLAQDIFHRWTTARGSLIDDPDFGKDAREYLSAACTPEMLQAAGGELALEALKDDRIADIVVEATLTAPGELSISGVITPADPALQPFTMILAVTAATLPTLEIR